MLEVDDLAISFPGRHNGVDVVDDVSFTVRSGEVLGLIGESGCGKSLTSLAIMGLQPARPGCRARSCSTGEDLLALPAARGAATSATTSR